MGTIKIKKKKFGFMFHVLYTYAKVPYEVPVPNKYAVQVWAVC